MANNDIYEDAESYLEAQREVGSFNVWASIQQIVNLFGLSQREATETVRDKAQEFSDRESR